MFSEKIIVKNTEELRNLFHFALQESQMEYEYFCDTFNDYYEYSHITDMSFFV